MDMLFEEIITTYYSEAFNQGLFSLAANEEGVYISSWNVPNVAQPTHDEIMALDTPQLRFQFELMKFFNQFSPFIERYIDSVAVARGYGNSLYCLSYFNSSNDKWKNDAVTFNDWRDAVWNYIIEQQQLIMSGNRQIPSDLNELINELPSIEWPQQRRGL